MSKAKARMYLPVRPDGTLMDEMFPSRSEKDALCAAARWTPKGNDGPALRTSSELAAVCWRAHNERWGFDDALTFEMAKLYGYTAVEVFLRPQKLPKVRKLVADLKKALSEATGPELTMLDPSEWEADIDAALAELDAVEGK